MQKVQESGELFEDDRISVIYESRSGRLRCTGILWDLSGRSLNSEGEFASDNVRCTSWMKKIENVDAPLL